MPNMSDVRDRMFQKAFGLAYEQFQSNRPTSEMMPEVVYALDKLMSDEAIDQEIRQFVLASLVSQKTEETNR